MSKKDTRISKSNITPPSEDVARAIQLINQSKNPCLIIGNGGRGYKEKIISFAEKIDAPIITTFKAKGCIPDSHPLACGVLGRSGTRVASAIMVRSDLLIVLGASFSDHTGISTKRITIQIDLDRMILGKFHKVDLPIWGDIKSTINQLVDKIDPKSNQERRDFVARLWKRWREEKTKRAARYDSSGRIPSITA